MTGVAIIGVGAVTPVGLSVRASCVALQSGIARLGPLPGYLVDDERGVGEPVTGGRVPLEWFDGGPEKLEWPGHEYFKVEIPPQFHLLIEDGPQRLVDLAVPAALEAWSATGYAHPPSATCGLFLGLDEADKPDLLVREIAQALRWTPGITEVIRAGRSAGFAALQHAVAAINAGHITTAIVGGVDSLIRPLACKALQSIGMLKCVDAPDGIIPGEAAAFLVIEAGSPGRSLARLLGLGLHDEPTAGTDKPNAGLGLTRAIRATGVGHLAEWPSIICDLTGDRYRGLEWALVRDRALGSLTWSERSGDLWHAADAIGDSGAASGILSIVWAVDALTHGYSRTDHILVWGASDRTLRAAAVIAKVD